MLNRSAEFWVALVAATLFVYRHSHDKVLPARLTQTAVSSGFGYSLTSEVSTWADTPELLTLVVLTSAGYLALDFVTALLADRKQLTDLIKAWVGRK